MHTPAIPVVIPAFDGSAWTMAGNSQLVRESH